MRENFSVKLYVYRVKECTLEHLDSIFRCTVPHNGSAEPIKSEIGRVVQKLDETFELRPRPARAKISKNYDTKDEFAARVLLQSSF